MWVLAKALVSEEWDSAAVHRTVAWMEEDITEVRASFPGALLLFLSCFTAGTTANLMIRLFHERIGPG